jgi:hypothetical protein
MENFVYQIQDNFIDLSQIKTFKLAVRFSRDTEKKRIEITLKDRRLKGEDLEPIKETIDIIFQNQVLAEEACENLRCAWEQFIRNNQ